MATYTRAQLRDAVLRELGVLDAQEVPSAEEAELADDRCQQELEYLFDQGFIQFDINGPIEAKYLLPLAWIIAYNLMLPYGVLSRANELLANHGHGMKRLSRLKEGDYWGEPAQTEYY